MRTTIILIIFVYSFITLLCTNVNKPNIVTNASSNTTTTTNKTTIQTTTTNHVTTNVTTTTTTAPVIPTRIKVHNSSGQTLYHIVVSCETYPVNSTVIGDISNNGETSFMITECTTNIIMTVWIGGYGSGTLCSSLPKYTLTLHADNVITIYGSWLTSCY
jgi:hypothetical protein